MTVRFRPTAGGTIVTVRLELLRPSAKTLKSLVGRPLRWLAKADPARSLAWQAVTIGENVRQLAVGDA